MFYAAWVVLSVQGASHPGGTSDPVESASAAIAYWNNVALDHIVLSQTPPPAAARVLAILSIAQFDALNSFEQKYKGYSYNSKERNQGSIEAAIHSASVAVLNNQYTSRRMGVNAQYKTIRTRLGASQEVLNGIKVGEESAKAILQLRREDGAHLSEFKLEMPAKVGIYQEPQNADVKAPTPGWGNVKPFCIGDCDQYLPKPVDLKSELYISGLQQVRILGSKTSSNRTADQTQTAKFWSFGGATITPPGAWNEIAIRYLNSRKVASIEFARTMALMNMALADAAIVSWNAKYKYALWRPKTAIDTFDPSWQPLMPTPNHPSYPSGHSTFSRAAATVLGSLFANQNQGFSYRGDKLGGYQVRTYKNFDEAANEAGMSRIYGGIHYPFDNVVGQEIGQKIGQMVLDSELRPLN
jgi:hypothetical protein